MLKWTCLQVLLVLMGHDRCVYIENLRLPRPQARLGAQPLATKELYGCGLPLAGAMTWLNAFSIIGTALGICAGEDPTSPTDALTLLRSYGVRRWEVSADTSSVTAIEDR